MLAPQGCCSLSLTPLNTHTRLTALTLPLRSVEFSSIVSQHAGHKWPPLKYAPEAFAVNHVRGPTLAPLAVDPGPLYSLHSPTEANTTAPTLLAVTRGYASSATALPQPTHEEAAAAASDGSALGSAEGAALGATAPHSLSSSAAMHTSASATASSLYPGILPSAARTDTDLLVVGPSAAVSVPRTLSGAASLLHMSTPSSSSSSSTTSSSAAFPLAAPPGAGSAASTHPQLRTVLHPLDAHPASRRSLAEETAGRAGAEAWRRRVAGAQARQDYLALHAYPHGVLGCDGPENEGSRVYGEVARAAAAAGAAAAGRAAAREAALLQHSCSVARRGYDLLAREEGRGGRSLTGAGVGAASVRLPGAAAAVAQLAGGRAERLVDGIKFLERKREVLPEHGVGVDTRRTVGVWAGVDGGRPAVRETRPVRVAQMLSGGGSRSGHNPITGLPLPPCMSPVKRG